MRRITQARESSSRMQVPMATPAQDTRFLALGFRQATHQDGDENDVVDAEHDLEQGQGGERDPGGGSAIHSSMIETLAE